MGTQSKQWKHIVAMATAALFFAACGGSGTPATTTADTTDDTDSAATSSATSVGNAIPTDVVISSVTETVAASSNIAVKAAGDPAADDYLSKKAALETLTAGDGDCDFTLALPTVTQPACYGPQLLYCDHEDSAVEATDDDCTPPEEQSPNKADDDGLPSGDLGIWSASEGTQACSAAQANYLVGDVASKVDNIIKMFGVMVCVGKKASIELPSTVGDISTLTTEMQGANMKVSGMTVTSATIEKMADSGENPVYKSTMEISMTFGAQTSTGKMVLTHSPTATDNATYLGNMNIAFASPGGMGGNCPSATTNVSAGTITYEKASATDVKYQYNWGGTYCTTDLDAPFTKESGDAAIITAGVAHGADAYDASANPDGWGDNFNFGRFAINPSDGSGSIAYAWQAGQGDGFTRVLNVSTSVADDVGSGTAYFGYGPDIGGTAATTTTAGVGSITGFFCNWAGPANLKNPNSDTLPNAFAQKQVLARAAGATDFTASSSNITYAPTNNCNATASGMVYHATANAAAGNSTFVAGDPLILTADNNHLDLEEATLAVTHDLIAVTAVDFTMPAAPTSL